MNASSHILTIALEDYFQVGAFNRVIQQRQWYRFETRLEKNARRTLDLLDAHNIKATFFVLGWIADKFPELVRSLADRGHEVASKGYYHRSIRQMTPEEFREDAVRSREALERATGQQVVGYRVAHEWFTDADVWAFDALAQSGYRYDSSIAPFGRSFAKEPFRRFAHDEATPHGVMHELPISTGKFFGVQLPIAGGNFLRQIPQFLIRKAVARWEREQTAPLVFYFHTWEIDPEQPQITAGSRIARLRHYRNLHRMEEYLAHFFRTRKFVGAADYLGIERETVTPSKIPERLIVQSPVSSEAMPISVVVPCFNEELILPYLANTLSSVENTLNSAGYAPTFILVDDGSSDGTWRGMQTLFADKPGFRVIAHERNQGVAAAIRTGIQAAETDVVCSMDCDCTYDPHTLKDMIPMLRPGVDLVTASPYHPEGRVCNVPGWRLGLSRGASWLYRRVLRHKLFTYTSCFRVYRRSSFADMPLDRTGYLGVAEMLGRIDLAGGRIVEFPATLEVRMLGRSKMKTVRTIIGHLGLMSHLFKLRLRKPLSPPARETLTEIHTPEPPRFAAIP